MIKTVFQQLKKVVTSITLKDVVYLLVIALLLGAFSTAVSRCSDVKHQYKNNMKALNDTITQRPFQLIVILVVTRHIHNEIESDGVHLNIQHATAISEPVAVALVVNVHRHIEFAVHEITLNKIVESVLLIAFAVLVGRVPLHLIAFYQ